VIHVPLDTGNTVFYALGALWGIPVVTSYHTLVSQYILAAVQRSNFVLRAIAKVLVFVHQSGAVLSALNSAALLPSSDIAAGDYTGNLPFVDQVFWQEKSVNWGPLVDTDCFKNYRGLDRVKGIRELISFGHVDEQILIFVGRLSAEKGIMFLVNSVMEARKRQMAVRLVLVGDGPLAGQLAGYHGETQGVYCVPKFIPHDELPLFYSAADVFVTNSEFETVGFTYLEALSSGTVAIAAKSIAADRIIKEPSDKSEDIKRGRSSSPNGWTFTADDTDSFLDALRRCNDHPTIEPEAVRASVSYASKEQSLRNLMRAYKIATSAKQGVIKRAIVCIESIIVCFALMWFPSLARGVNCTSWWLRAYHAGAFFLSLAVATCLLYYPCQFVYNIV